MSTDRQKYDVRSHYRFGRNWRDLTQRISDTDVRAAEARLQSLLQGRPIDGKTVIDIGSGSGLHALAALRLGAKHVTAVDFDPDSVAASAGTLRDRWGETRHECRQGNILTDFSDNAVRYDLVYSWGVLHHTGDMWTAIDRAADLVAPGGLFALAIYKKSPLCRLWKFEKRLYSSLPVALQKLLSYPYLWWLLFGYLLAGQSPWRVYREYPARRGMRMIIDVRDWLGGFPYESATPGEIEAFLTTRGFGLVHAANTAPVRALGAFGSGCAEYLFEKVV